MSEPSRNTDDDEVDIAASFAEMNAKARKRMLRAFARKAPAVGTMTVAWAGLVVIGVGWLIAAFPAALLGAAAYRATERLVPEEDD
jgi:hypothetical protein